MSRRGLLAAAFAAFATTAGAADATPYPITVRITVSAGANARYTRAPSSTSAWPPEPSGSADLVAQAQAAYAAMGGRVFRAVGFDAFDLELGVTISGADIDVRSSGSTATVEHRVVARTPAGEVVGEWQVRGDETFVAGSMEAAFARAARAAADELELGLEQAPALAAWLRARNVPPRTLPSRLQAKVEAPPTPGVLGAFVEASGAVVSSSYGGDFSTVGHDLAFGLRTGLQTGSVRGALTFGRWSAAYAPSPYSYGANTPGVANVTTFGVELAGRYRTALGVEFHAGGGLHMLRSSYEHRNYVNYPNVSTTESNFAPSLFAALGYSRCRTGGSVCFEAGMEIRRYLGTTLAHLPLDVAKLSLGAFVGAEYRFELARIREWAARQRQRTKQAASAGAR